MSEWYENLRNDEFFGKHVRVTLVNGMIVEGSIASSEVFVQNHMYYFVKMNAAPFAVWFGNKLNEACRDIIILSECSEDGLWKPCNGVKTVDLIWDEREHEKIPVDQVKTGDWIILEGRKYLVTQVVGSTIVASAGTYLEVDKSMISTALRRRNGESS